MMNSVERKKTITLYSILFLLCAAVIHATNIYSMRSLVMFGDSYNGYYPGFAYIGRYLRALPISLLKGQIPIYDFSIGFGENIIEALNWGGFGDPFNLISVFFPVKYSAIGYTLAQLLRMYFAGLFFLLWALNRHAEALPAITGSVFYTFSMYTVLFGLNFSTFMTALTILPLLALGVDKMLSSKGRISYNLIFGMALQGVCGFYWIYMDSLFFILYIPLSCIYEHKLKISAALNRFGAILLNYLGGLALSAAFFLPGTYIYLISNRTSSVSFSLADYLKVYSLDEYIVKMDTLLTPHRYHIDSLFLGIGFLLSLIILYGLKRGNEYRMWKILCAVTFIGYLLPGFGRIMNGFAYTAERWTYLLYFVFAYVITIGMDNISSTKQVQKIIFTVLFPGWLFLALYSNPHPDIAFYIRVSAFSLLWIIMVVAFFYVPKRKLLCVLTILSVVTCQMVIYYPKQVFCLNQFSVFRMNGVYDTLISNNSAFVQNSATDQSDRFFRTDLYGDCPDISLMTGTNSTVSYYSAHNTSIYEFFRTFGFSPSLFGNSVILVGLDGRLPAEMLFSVRSYADPTTDDKVMINPYCLPIGFTYDSYLPASTLNGLGLADANALLADVVFLEDTDISTSIPPYKSSLSRTVPIEIHIDYGDIISENNIVYCAGDKTLKLTPDPDFSYDSDQEYYLVFESLNTLSDIRFVTIGSKQLRLLPDGTTASFDGDCMVKISAADVFDADTPLTITFQEGLYTLSDIKLFSVNTEHYREAYDLRNRYTLQNVKLGINTVSGTISIPTSQILFMSIPYDPFWQCTVDNQKATIQKADNGFCAVELPAGDHEICFRYSSPVNTAGLIISIATAFVLLMCYIRTRNKQKKK